MATVTPNFNWPVPTSTDLVKDGATAIEALGDSIDGSLVDLKGGTTGQVLSKTSGTDMDFTWVTTDDANAIQNSIVDAKGDLIAASANDTPARLAVGANGETLVADSSTATGLRYQVPVNSNPIINSAFQIAQRGTSFSLSNSQQYTLDRWFAATGNTGTYSRQATGDTTNLPFIQYCMRVQRTAGQTATNDFVLQQPMETINSIPFAGKTVTMSFYARKGADFSGASSNIRLYLISGTGTDQNFSVAWTGQQLPINNPTATLTTTWQRFTYTGTVGATATELTPYFYYTPSGTAGAADYYEITGVQLEVGSVATPFKTNGATIQGELAACQRYYFRMTGGSSASTYGMGYARNTTVAVFPIPMKQTMRIEPTSVDFSALRVSSYGATSPAVTSLTFDGVHSGPDYMLVLATVASGLTALQAYDLANDANAAGFIGFNAEL